MRGIIERAERLVETADGVPRCLAPDAPWPWTHKLAGKPGEYWESGRFQVSRDGDGWRIDEYGKQIWSGSTAKLCQKLNTRKFR